MPKKKKTLGDLPFEFNKKEKRMDLIMSNECLTILCNMGKKTEKCIL